MLPGANNCVGYTPADANVWRRLPIRDPASRVGTKCWVDIFGHDWMGRPELLYMRLILSAREWGLHPLTTKEVNVVIAGSLVRDTHRPRCRPVVPPPSPSKAVEDEQLNNPRLTV